MILMFTRTNELHMKWRSLDWFESSWPTIFSCFLHIFNYWTVTTVMVTVFEAHSFISDWLICHSLIYNLYKNGSKHVFFIDSEGDSDNYAEAMYSGNVEVKIFSTIWQPIVFFQRPGLLSDSLEFHTNSSDCIIGMNDQFIVRDATWNFNTKTAFKCKSSIY